MERACVGISSMISTECFADFDGHAFQPYKPLGVADFNLQRVDKQYHSETNGEMPTLAASTSHVHAAEFSIVIPLGF